MLPLKKEEEKFKLYARSQTKLKEIHRLLPISIERMNIHLHFQQKRAASIMHGCFSRLRREIRENLLPERKRTLLFDQVYLRKHARYVLIPGTIQQVDPEGGREPHLFLSTKDDMLLLLWGELIRMVVTKS